MPLLCFAVVKEERSTRSLLAYVPCPEERATPLSVVPSYQLQKAHTHPVHELFSGAACHPS